MLVSSKYFLFRHLIQEGANILSQNYLSFYNSFLFRVTHRTVANVALSSWTPSILIPSLAVTSPPSLVCDSFLVFTLTALRSTGQACLEHPSAWVGLFLFFLLINCCLVTKSSLILLGPHGLLVIAHGERCQIHYLRRWRFSFGTRNQAWSLKSFFVAVFY